MTREQVLEALANERTTTGGLISDATLLRLIAAKHGVEVPSERIVSRKLSTGIIVPQLNDVTISGRVIAVYPPRTYEGQKPGRYASLTIADRDGVLRVMLWNERVAYIESGELRTGAIVRFSHGYTREDRIGKTELHIGEKGKIEINPQDLIGEDFPSLDECTTRIREITNQRSSVNLSGLVKEVFALSTFTRQDQTSGQVLRFKLSDETGEAVVVAWNEKAGELEKKLRQGTKVRLVNAKVKAASGDTVEIHIDASACVEISANHLT
jgi:ssDNA-binding replication factor A large subunit